MNQYLLRYVKNNLRPRWMKTVRRLVSSRIKLAWLTSKLSLRSINNDLLSDIKRSDTLCILGSGASINALSSKELDFIKEKDSIGFNFWMLHDLIPSLYVFEPPSGIGMDCMLNNFLCKKDNYKSLTFLLKDGERYRSDFLMNFINKIPHELRGNVQLSWDWEIPDEDVEGFTKTVKLLARSKLLKASWFPNIRKRASVFYLILLGVRAGYRNIILYGVDLNNNTYFYDEHREYLEKNGMCVPMLDRDTSLHKTDNPFYGQLTISKIIEILNKDILPSTHSKIFIASKESKLYPMLPLFSPE